MAFYAGRISTGTSLAEDCILMICQRCYDRNAKTIKKWLEEA